LHDQVQIAVEPGFLLDFGNGFFGLFGLQAFAMPVALIGRDRSAAPLNVRATMQVGLSEVSAF
jgi:hypothetical protein